MKVRVALISACIATQLFAQSAADQDWQRLLNKTKSPPPVAAKDKETATQAARALDRQTQKKHLLEVAALADEFQRRNPTRTEAKEARRLEAKSRLGAALLDEGPPDARLDSLARAARNDASLPADARFEVAHLSEMLRLKKQPPRSRAAWLAEKKAVAQAMVAEFPSVPGAHGLLLDVARVSDGPAGAAIAREILLSAAPSEVKTQARVIVERHALVGQKLSDITGGVLGASSALAPAAGKPVVLYTWRPGNDASLDLAKELGKLAPKGAVVLGINVSPQQAEVAAKSPPGRLPGTQLYGGRGGDSPLVRRLQLTEPGLVYTVDRAGVIRSVDAQRNLAAQLLAIAGV